MRSIPLIRKIVEDEIEKLKSSNIHSSDADLYVGFKFGDEQDTANENEYDPRTGKLVKNDTVGNHTTYLNQWDADNTGYLEEDEPRDNGVGLARIVMQQITPIQ